MGQSLSKILVHAIFSTKNRTPCLTSQIRPELYRYTASVLQTLECPAIEIGGVADHIHILCRLSKNLSASELIEEIKKPTSKWIKTKSTTLRNFYWQSGYGAFSVSASETNNVVEYIRTQEEHHKGWTFQDEFRRFLERNEVEYDEKYVWD